MPKLCLNMIVKNESHIISKTLKNICQHIPIDYWIISDTGSTDDTIDCIKNTMQELGIQGEIFQDEWVNFSHNRNLALSYAKNKADYLFFFDADDYIEGNIELPATLTADAYYMKMTSEDKSTAYQRQLIVKNNIANWRGVLHEFINLPPNSQIDTIKGNYHIISGRKGSRNLDTQKYLKDALILKHALETNQDEDLHSRYSFYCAQSYMDAGHKQEAIDWYKKRVQYQNGWSEEAYVSCARLGAMLEELGNEAEALYYFTLGTQINPQRAECWYQLARLNSWKGRSEISYLFAEKAASLSLPNGILFAHMEVYQYWCHYQLFISARNTERLQVAYNALKNLIHSPATNSLYLNELPTIKALKPYAIQDTYEAIQHLKNKLQANGGEAVIEALML